MFTFLIIVIALIGILMTLIILLQSGKGGGLAGIAAGGTQQVLGSRSAPDILEKATWVLGFGFILLCILTNFAIDRGGDAPSIIQQGAADQAPGQIVIPPASDQPVPADGDQ
jgi:preprotein translocase subunit SecG